MPILRAKISCTSLQQLSGHHNNIITLYRLYNDRICRILQFQNFEKYSIIKRVRHSKNGRRADSATGTELASDSGDESGPKGTRCGLGNDTAALVLATRRDALLLSTRVVIVSDSLANVRTTRKPSSSRKPDCGSEFKFNRYKKVAYTDTCITYYNIGIPIQLYRRTIDYRFVVLSSDIGKTESTICRKNDFRMNTSA